MKYSNAQIAYHWLSFVLIGVMAATGLAYSYEWVEGDVMRVHQMAGQLLIAVLALRLGTRLIRRSPAKATSHKLWERRLANIVQLALYGVMIAYVASGYISASAETSNILIAPVSLGFARSDLGEQILYLHYNLKWVLLGLVALHIGGALKHALIDRDDTLAQMRLRRPSKPS